MNENEQLKQALIKLIEAAQKACDEKYDLKNAYRRNRLKDAIAQAREALPGPLR